MKGGVWMWRLAVSFYSAALIVFASPTLAGVAAVSLGDVQFSWGHVLVLMGIGAAWQDMRTNRARDREEFAEFKKQMREELHELRTDRQ